jgi:signal transduction histidine kinase
MTLKRKFLLRNLVLMTSLLLVGGAALWGLAGLRQHVRFALNIRDEIRALHSINNQLAQAQLALQPANSNRARAQGLVTRAAAGVQQFIDREKMQYDVSYAQTGLQKVREAAAVLGDETKPLAAAIEPIQAAQVGLATIIEVCHTIIERRNEMADNRLRWTMVVIGGIFALSLVGAGVSSVQQYRGVMGPLERLRQGAQRLGEAEFTERLPEVGEPEFVELAVEFNRMAGELEGFYHKLEEKVIAKSKELVRSERLASVGFLAAGVAHEINNPLNVISGYAELSAKRLSNRRDDDADIVDAAQALKIIRDEAFRCKDITSRLLSLARGGSDTREPLDLNHVAREVAMMTKGLKDYRDRQVELKFSDQDSLRVFANATEMKQVLLNLTVNALEAVKPGIGKVWIQGRRSNGWVEVSVQDNGCGIPPDSLKHVFEPFYTKKCGSRAPGTGLGLSITHAIVENHGGRIIAASDGVGRGSCFTVQLPARAGRVS